MSVSAPIAVDAAREEAELRTYLGRGYDHARLIEYDRQLEQEYARIGDEAVLYRTSEAYLYNLTAFAMTRTKEPYLNDLAGVVPAPARLLDYGCGIGSDGLLLLEAGYEVAFADFDNPSTRYLRWRLKRRGLSAPIHDLDTGPPPGEFDAAFAFDVIEHVQDPFEFLLAMEHAARTVCVNLLEPEPGETGLHHELPVDALRRHAAAHGLRRARRYHGRSHLLIYDREPAGVLGRLRGRARLLRSR